MEQRDQHASRIHFESYEAVAAEYYDSTLHPTCNNFREASKRITRRWMGEHLSVEGMVCEVGAGKSLVAEIMQEEKIPLDRLVISDASRSMLAYSEQWHALGAELLVAPVESLPLPDGVVSLLVSSLGDPYNTPHLWREAARILEPGGYTIFTTPAYEWAVRFRADETPETVNAAEFELRSGERVFVPSFVFAEAEQTRMIEHAGLAVIDVQHVSLSELSGVVSQKLLTVGTSTGRVVTGYLARKP